MTKNVTVRNERLCALLGIRTPIIQAPTGSIAGVQLAEAVSSAGGLGSLGLTWTEPDAAAKSVGYLRSKQLPVLVNFALHFEPKSLQAAVEAGATCVTFSWGDPAPFLDIARAKGAVIGVQVGSVEGAQRAVNQGADFVILQGVEAGGHVQGASRLLHQVREARAQLGEEAVLVAAGGIATGEDVAEAMLLGADGVMIGTRFVATVESGAHDDYKQRIVEASSTALTTCFDGGWPHAAHRVLVNSTLRDWIAAGSPPPGKRPGEGDEIGRSAGGEAIYRYEDTAPRVGMTGDMESMALYAGAGVGSIMDIVPAGQLVEQLWREARELL